jgi:hypothetical protein
MDLRMCVWQLEGIIKHDFSKMMRSSSDKNPLQEAGIANLLDAKLSLGRLIRSVYFYLYACVLCTGVCNQQGMAAQRAPILLLCTPTSMHTCMF